MPAPFFRLMVIRDFLNEPLGPCRGKSEDPPCNGSDPVGNCASKRLLRRESVTSYSGTEHRPGALEWIPASAGMTVVDGMRVGLGMTVAASSVAHISDLLLKRLDDCKVILLPKGAG